MLMVSSVGVDKAVAILQNKKEERKLCSAAKAERWQGVAVHAGEGRNIELQDKTGRLRAPVQGEVQQTSQLTQAHST